MESTTTRQYINCKPWQLFLWPCHSATSNFFFILMMFAGYVATGGYGILVATAGVIATGTRLFDSLIDPFIVLITDRINTRIGRVRVLMLVGRGIQIISVFAMFYWGLGRGAVVYTAIYLVYIIGSTVSAIATHTGNPILTTNPKQRPQIFRWQMIYSITFGALFQMFLSKVLLVKHGGKMGIPLFQEICLIVVGVAVVFEILAWIGISPVDRAENYPKKDNGKNVNMLDMLKMLKGNRAMQMFVIGAVTDKIASQAASQAAITTLVYGVIIANYKFSGTFSAYALVPNILLIFFGTYFMGRTGTKKALILWTTISLSIAAVIIAFMSAIDPATISKSAIPTAIFIVLNLAFTAAKNVTSASTNAMVPDIVDYELSRTGNFMPGTVGTLYSFIDEMFSSLSTTIVGFCLAAVGYVSKQPQPGDPSSTKIFWMTMFLWMGMPILGWICTLVAMKWYPLTKTKMEEVQLINHEKRQKAAVVVAD